MELLTPIGRIVQGTPFTFSTTNKKGLPLTFKDGNPRKSYWFSMAVKKTNKLVDRFIDSLVEAAKADYPSHKDMITFPSENFSWKIIDGDHKDWCDRDGYSGCWVFKFGTSFAPQIIDGKTKEELISDQQFKTGDYAQVYVRVAGNGDTDFRRGNPGIYLNQLAVSKVTDGEPIQQKTDYSSVFDKVDVDL